MITLGGNAELELVDSMDPFSEGIIFSVMPPKKSWKNISNLSGGEKVSQPVSFSPIPTEGLSIVFQTLSSLALVFALHVFKVCLHPWLTRISDLCSHQPTPLYFMDEIDAALDFRNVSIVANYIKDRTKNAQFIIISLRYSSLSLMVEANTKQGRRQKWYVRTCKSVDRHLQDLKCNSKHVLSYHQFWPILISPLYDRYRNRQSRIDGHTRAEHSSVISLSLQNLAFWADLHLLLLPLLLLQLPPCTL